MSGTVNEALAGPIVITGAAGFIGRNVVAELNRRGRTDLVLVDRLGTDERWSNLVGLDYAELLDADAFIAAVRDGSAAHAGTVIHLGACSATTERNAGFLLENNYRYSRHLAEWCLARGIRMVYASSAATYGDGELGYDDDDVVTARLRPLNMYGYSKHLFDQWALTSGVLASGALTSGVLSRGALASGALANTSTSSLVGLKYFNVFGPFEDHKGDMRSVVNKSYARIAAGQDVELFRSHRQGWADGEQQRDFIYVRDVVDVTLHFADRRTPGGLYNCGTGKARSWLDLARALFSAMGEEPRIRMIDMPETLRGKYQYLTQASTTKLRHAGYDKPFTSLEDGVRDYVTTHLALQGA